MHGDAAVCRQPSVPALPGQEVVAGELVVGVLCHFGHDVDHRQRHHQRVRWNQVGRHAGLGKMDRRIEVRAGMLVEPPPMEIVAVLLEVELLLHLDPGLAEEGRKGRRHGVGEIDRAAEAAGYG
jgi:hypothetical protein